MAWQGVDQAGRGVSRVKTGIQHGRWTYFKRESSLFANTICNCRWEPYGKAIAFEEYTYGAL